MTTWDISRPELWDPGQWSRLPPLPEAGLDPNRYPCHRRGTWESALATLAAGYRPTPEDVKALRHWTKDLTTSQRRAYIYERRAARVEIVATARQTMGRREVVPLSALERRVHAHLDGKHSHTVIKDTLTALATLTMLDAEAEPGVRSVANMYRQHYVLLGKHVHYFSRSRKNLEAYPAKAYAARQAVGRNWGEHGIGHRFTSQTGRAANARRWEKQRQRQLQEEHQQQQRKDLTA